MDVVHILWSGRIGGKERAVYQLVRSQLMKSVFRPAVAFGQAEGLYADRFRELGCPVVDLRMRRGGDVLRLPYIAAKLKPFRLHHFHSAEGAIMLGSSFCRGVTRLYTHRGGIPARNTAKRVSYRLLGLLLRGCFHGFAGNTQHAAICGSVLTGVPRSEWTVTYNGVDFSQLDPGEPKAVVAARQGLEPAAMTIIGTSANLRALKRNELLFEACSRLPRDLFRLLIVGDGPDRPRLEGLARQLGLERNTVFTGMQRHVGDYLTLMDIFVLASGPQESFGNSAVEAMGVGLPTIVFRDGGGLPEHIKDGQTGFVVDSVDELASRLRMLLDDADQRKAVGRKAAQYAREAYSLESMVRRYDEFYVQVLRQKCKSACRDELPGGKRAQTASERKP